MLLPEPTSFEMKKRLKEMKWTQNRLAAELGVSGSLISQIFSRQKEINQEWIDRVRAILGMSDGNVDPLDLRIARFKAEYERGEVLPKELVSEGISLIKPLQNAHDDIALADVYYILADLYRRDNFLQYALHYIDLAKELYAKSGNEYSVCKALQKIAEIEFASGHFESAEIRFRQAEIRLNTVGVGGDPLLYEIYLGLAKCASVFNDTTNMQKYTELCEEHFSLVPVTKQLRYSAGQDFLNARILTRTKCFTDAIALFTRAYTKYQTARDMLNMFAMGHNIAKAHLETGDLHKAELLAVEIYNQKTSGGDTPTSIAYTLNLLAQIHIERKNYKAAEKIIDQVTGSNLNVGIAQIAHAHKWKAHLKLKRDNDLNGFVNCLKEAIKIIGHENPRLTKDFVLEMIQVEENFHAKK